MTNVPQGSPPYSLVYTCPEMTSSAGHLQITWFIFLILQSSSGRNLATTYLAIDNFDNFEEDNSGASDMQYIRLLFFLISTTLAYHCGAYDLIGFSRSLLEIANKKFNTSWPAWRHHAHTSVRPQLALRCRSRHDATSLLKSQLISR